MSTDAPTANLAHVVLASKDAGQRRREIVEEATKATALMGKADGLRTAGKSLLDYLGKRRVLTSAEIRGAADAFIAAADGLDAKAKATLAELDKMKGSGAGV